MLMGELQQKNVDPASIDNDEELFTYTDSGIFSKDAEAASVKDAVLDGQIVELRSIMFYKEIKKGMKSDNAIKVIDEILEQEQMHFNILKSWEAAV